MSAETRAEPTPGPWELFTSCSWRRYGNPTTGDMVCIPIRQESDGHPDLLFPNGGQDGPDARLIAAAPELLEAAKDAERLCETFYDDFVETGSESWDASDRPKAVAAVRRKLRAAIAKARGEAEPQVTVRGLE